MKTARRAGLGLLAVTCAVAVAAAPTAVAADGGGKAKAAQKAKSAQSAKTVNRRLKSTRRSLSSTRRRLNTTRKDLRKLTNDLGALSKRLEGSEGSVNLLMAAAPQLVSGLQQLSSAVQNQIAPNLQKLGDAVQKEIVPNLQKLGDAVQKEIAPNLQKLGDAYGSVEYGRAGLFVDGSALPVIAAGGAVTSADIPDDGNSATVTESAVVATGDSGTLTINLRAAIRSGESDGDAADETAGQAGGFLLVKNLDTGERVACMGTPDPPGIIGTVPGDQIQTPAGPVATLPLKNIPGGVPRTDQAAPQAASTSLLPAACVIGVSVAGTTYEVHYSVNFVDIPTSTTPGPTE